MNAPECWNGGRRYVGSSSLAANPETAAGWELMEGNGVTSAERPRLRLRLRLHQITKVTVRASRTRMIIIVAATPRAELYDPGEKLGEGDAFGEGNCDIVGGELKVTVVDIGEGIVGETTMFELLSRLVHVEAQRMNHT